MALSGGSIYSADCNGGAALEWLPDTLGEASGRVDSYLCHLVNWFVVRSFLVLLFVLGFSSSSFSSPASHTLSFYV